ncbi:hypothetical protein [Enterovibrio nigricans]|uniref:Terminase-like family protein n=1 Tax=Enterovibrio nigricans DSM 22720 TaxID=1121868 RepID=A0A1T4V5V4_9GAMM|nr:hypothetical protein [Enterovibrio nigricans]PKF49891.1 hypothetical protein AT251_15690 [Enterovibrio nigricans]SKA60329.1 Terminase-like family protein [Enterovibrio nigricans DSM 22720]
MSIKLTPEIWEDIIHPYADNKLTRYFFMQRMKDEIPSSHHKEFVEFVGLYKNILALGKTDDGFTRLNHYPQVLGELMIVWTTEANEKSIRKIVPKDTTVLAPLDGGQLAFAKMNIPVFNFKNEPIGVKNRCHTTWYGGQAGGGKSALAIFSTMKWLPILDWNTLVLRNSARDVRYIRKEGIKHSRHLASGEKSKILMERANKDFRFYQQGDLKDKLIHSTISFDHANEGNCETNYQGSELSSIVWEELTQIGMEEYLYLTTRLRMSGETVLPDGSTFDLMDLCNIVATMNPKHDSWVKGFLESGNYLDSDECIKEELSGVVRFVTKIEDGVWDWAETEEELRAKYPQKKKNGKYKYKINSFSFVIGKLDENKHIPDSYDAGAGSEQSRVALEDGSWRQIDSKGALWDKETINRNRLPVRAYARDAMREVVISIDPAFGDKLSPNSNKARKADSVGLCAVGRSYGDTSTTKGYLIEDRTDDASGLQPAEWLKMAVEMALRHGASKIVYESNQGSTMFEGMTDLLDNGRYKHLIEMHPIHSAVSKEKRARPVSIMYANNRISHVGIFPTAEGEMCSWDPNKKGQKSPGSIDAISQGFNYLFSDLLNGTSDFSGFDAEAYELDDVDPTLRYNRDEIEGEQSTLSALTEFIEEMEEWDDVDFSIDPYGEQHSDEILAGQRIR